MLGERPETRQFKVYLKIFPYREEAVTLNRKAFANGIGLSAAKGIRIVGYTVVAGCPGCGFYVFDVCGPRLDTESFNKIYPSLGHDDLYLTFYNITIEIRGSCCNSESFVVYPEQER